jgi:hypothetical protein
MYWSDKRFYKIQVGADVTATLIEEAAMESQVRQLLDVAWLDMLTMQSARACEHFTYLGQSGLRAAQSDAWKDSTAL